MKKKRMSWTVNGSENIAKFMDKNFATDYLTDTESKIFCKITRFLKNIMVN